VRTVSIGTVATFQGLYVLCKYMDFNIRVNGQALSFIMSMGRDIEH
jgi:hypothetical protein